MSAVGPETERARIELLHLGYPKVYSDNETFCDRQNCTCGLPSQKVREQNLAARANYEARLAELKAAMGKADAQVQELGQYVYPDAEGNIVIPKDGWYRIEGGKLTEDNGGYRIDEAGSVVSKQDLLGRYDSLLKESALLADRLNTRLKRQAERLDEAVFRQSRLVTLATVLIGHLTAYDPEGGARFMRDLEEILGGGDNADGARENEAAPSADGG